jgi:hypothetical protein
MGSDPAVSLSLRDLILPFKLHHWIRFIGLIETSESLTKMFKSDPTVSLKRGIRSCGLIETVGADPAVSLKQWDLILRSHWNSGIQSSSFNDSGKSFSVVSMKLYRIFYKNVKLGSRSLIEAVEPIPRSHWNRRKQSPRCLIESAETIPMVLLRPQNLNFANDYLEYLGEYKAICQTACESGPYRRYCLMKETEVRKSRDTVSLLASAKLYDSRYCKFCLTILRYNELL